MCGRFACALSGDGVAAAASSFICREVSWKKGCTWEGRASIHPGRPLPVLVRDSGEVCLETMTWGLVPAYAKEVVHDHFRLFNARSETCESLDVFSRLVATGRRGVVVMEGFYEWKLDWKGEKQPYFVRMETGPMFVAALFDRLQEVGNIRHQYNFYPPVT